MRLYEYLIGGKKTGRIEDLKDPMTGSKPFRDLKEGESFFISEFKPNGTRTYTDEIKITSIHKEHTYWTFTGFRKEGTKYAHLVEMKDLDKKLVVCDLRSCYRALSTFEMDAEPLFELTKKEIEN